jgi:hypothetical protein
MSESEYSRSGPLRIPPEELLLSGVATGVIELLASCNEVGK